MNQHPHIALVSTNRNKYSETFIQNHLNYFNGKIHYLFDGYLPHKVSVDKGLSFTSFLKHTFWLRYLFLKDETYLHTRLKKKIKAYLLKHKIQLIYCEYGPAGVECMQLAEECQIPLIVHFHGYDAYRNDILSSYGQQYPTLFQKAKAIVVPSKHMYKQLIDLTCPATKLHLIPYGVDTNLFQKQVNKQKQFDFVFCGRFVEKKGPLQIIKAFAKLQAERPNITLCMIGDGELWQECKDFATRSNLQHQVTFKGILKPFEVAKFLNASKLFLLFSNTSAQNDSEGLPNSILEAGACELAVISTKHAGISEIINDYENGVLIKEKDEEALYLAMKQLITQPDLAEQLGQKLRLTIESEFQLHDKIRMLNDLILNSLN